MIRRYLRSQAGGPADTPACEPEIRSAIAFRSRSFGTRENLPRDWPNSSPTDYKLAPLRHGRLAKPRLFPLHDRSPEASSVLLCFQSSAGERGFSLRGASKDTDPDPPHSPEASCAPPTRRISYETFWTGFCAACSRSFFLRRALRLFTLSLPLECPIIPNTHPSAAGAKLIRRRIFDERGPCTAAFPGSRIGFSVKLRIQFAHLGRFPSMSLIIIIIVLLLIFGGGGYAYRGGVGGGGGLGLVLVILLVLYFLGYLHR
jgi:hypothetical protein